MPDVSARIRDLRSLENLSAGKTAIHRLHPLAKLLSCAVFIIFTASYGRYDFIRLVPYLFYPFVMAALAELPFRLLFSRVLVALPFCLFAGVSNVIYDTGTVYSAGGFTLSFGMLSLATILLKMFLCVMAALLLVATTPFTELTSQLRRLRVPAAFVMVFEMTYRYVGVLLEEVYSMTTAYKLRSGVKKAIEMRHMGSFAGQLLLRAVDRAERVYAAMRCRGYSLRHVPPPRSQYQWKDALAFLIVCVPAFVLRSVL